MHHVPPKPPTQTALERALWPKGLDPERVLALTKAQQFEQDRLTEPHMHLPWAGGAGRKPRQLAPNPTGEAAILTQVCGLDAHAGRYSLEAHLSLAVALDVLSTELVALHDTDAQLRLSMVTSALLGLLADRPMDGFTGEPRSPGDDAQLDPTLAHRAQQLRAITLGATGEARAALAPQLSAFTGALSEVDSLQEGMAVACLQLCQGAQEVIARARLALEAIRAKSNQGVLIGP